MNLPMRFAAVIVTAALAACTPAVPATEAPVLPSATPLPPTATATYTPSPTLSPTPHPPTLTPTATPVPQRLLLRRACGRDYVARSGEALEVLYGGWGVIGSDLAELWSSAMIVELTVDGTIVEGHPHPPTIQLPMNCRGPDPNLYWLYWSALLPDLAGGTHSVTVTFNALRPLDDGSGTVYGPGQIAVQTFRILVQ